MKHYCTTKAASFFFRLKQKWLSLNFVRKRFFLSLSESLQQCFPVQSWKVKLENWISQFSLNDGITIVLFCRVTLYLYHNINRILTQVKLMLMTGTVSIATNFQLTKNCISQFSNISTTLEKVLRYHVNSSRFTIVKTIAA